MKTRSKTRLTDEERRRKFFYAEADAGLYDQTIDLVVPQYRLMHQTMIDLLEYHFCFGKHLAPAEISGTILDVGSGTGAESIGVMKKFPGIRVVALDLCTPMKKEFRKNFEDAFGSNVSFSDRVQFSQGDFLSDKVTPDALRQLLPKDERDKGYKAVISAFTIHHLYLDEKMEAYRRIFEVLEPGGMIINGDLFNYHSPSLTKYAHDYDMNWIARQFKNPNPEFAGAVPESERERLSKRWLRHYEKDNLLDSAEVQMKILREVGFTETGTPFRFWQVGILWGIKSNGTPKKITGEK